MYNSGLLIINNSEILTLMISRGFKLVFAYTCIKYVSSSNQNNTFFPPQIISLTINRAVRRSIPSVSSLKKKHALYYNIHHL